MIRIGTAGWAIPKDARERFPRAESRLQEYASVFPCVEINSTFHRSHRNSTYERWAGSVPANFLFSLKVPKAITHEHRLEGCAELLKAFLDETSALGKKRGALLVQLPPSFGYDPRIAIPFFETLRTSFAGAIACEPRHPSWFDAATDGLLRTLSIARVAADPPRFPEAARPGGTQALRYYRWHGAPRTYYSAYDPERIASLAAVLAAERPETWCIFDNTALGAATSNALLLAEKLSTERRSPEVVARTCEQRTFET